MRIKGFTRPSIIDTLHESLKVKREHKKPSGGYLKAYVSIDYPDTKGFIEFLIDTGASEMIISQRDIEESLKLKYKDLEVAPPKEWKIGLGGEVKTYYIPKARIYFQQEKGGWTSPLPSMKIPVLNHDDCKDKKLRELLKNSPSLIGINILKKYALFINMTEEIVLLTDEVKRI